MQLKTMLYTSVGTKNTFPHFLASFLTVSPSLKQSIISSVKCGRAVEGTSLMVRGAGLNVFQTTGMKHAGRLMTFMGAHTYAVLPPAGPHRTHITSTLGRGKC